MVDGQALTVPQVACVGLGSCKRPLLAGAGLADRMQKSADLVANAIHENQTIYGVTTGFGGMAEFTVDPEQASASQNNLMAFLATGAGAPIAARHTRAAMLLRANVMAQGCSGVRPELVHRLLRFLRAGATPVVRELGSIGASGDLVPLSVIARAITGQPGFVNIQLGNRTIDSSAALRELDLEAIKLLPKEGLALVNGTSFSSAIAANCVYEFRHLMALAMAVEAMLMEALNVQREPFEDFVHKKKAHPGQQWTARVMRQLLLRGREQSDVQPKHVQDRYSLRCLPQYMGSIVEGLARITGVVETEMNSVSDNPLVDVEQGRFYQSGNFLGQYVGLAMDDLRKYTGLLAKHLDVQIATLVSPEFSNGLPASLRGNPDIPYNMGLKGLQITGNSIMPMLTWYGNSIVDHYPTHAEQYNQNINGLSWGSANLAWKSVELFQHYLSVAMVFGVQSLDLRAHAVHGHYDGRVLVGTMLADVYEGICKALNVELSEERPLVFDDVDHWLEQGLASLAEEIQSHGAVVESVDPVLRSFDEEFSG